VGEASLHTPTTFQGGQSTSPSERGTTTQPLLEDETIVFDPSSSFGITRGVPFRLRKSIVLVAPPTPTTIDTMQCFDFCINEAPLTTQTQL